MQWQGVCLVLSAALVPCASLPPPLASEAPRLLAVRADVRPVALVAEGGVVGPVERGQRPPLELARTAPPAAMLAGAVAATFLGKARHGWSLLRRRSGERVLDGSSAIEFAPRALVMSGVTGVVAAVCLRAVPALRGALRACNFWRRAFPFFLRYKWAEWRINSEEKTPEARECRWDLLHDYYAPILLRHILELRGYFIKVGQFASSRNDFIASGICGETLKYRKIRVD